MVYRESAAEGMTAIAAGTDTGQSAKFNEDTYLVVDLSGSTNYGPEAWSECFLSQNRFVLGVFDGTGATSEGGRRASRVAAETVGHILRHLPQNVTERRLNTRLLQAFEIADEEVLYHTYRDEKAINSVTTATVAVVTPTAIQLGHVGDSRAYMVRGGRLVQLTRDDSLVNKYLQKGNFSVEEVEGLENSNFITQALGTRRRVAPFTAPIELCRHDTLLLCTRGLWSLVSRETITDILAAYSEPEASCRALLEAANDKGGFENVTVIVANFAGNWLDPPDDQNDLDDEDVLQRARDKQSARATYRARRLVSSFLRTLHVRKGRRRRQGRR
jgi:protein phosphatase